MRNARRPRPPRVAGAKLVFIASFHITSGVLEELPDDHEAHEEEEHIDDDHKELLSRTPILTCRPPTATPHCRWSS